MRRRSVVALLVVALFAAPVWVGAVGASPQPRYVCGACGESLERVGHEVDVPVTVEESDLAIRIHEDGSGTWRIRTELAPETAERLRGNATAMDRLLQGAYGQEAYRTVEDPGLDEVDARLEDETLVVTFTVPDMARDGVGDVVLVDYFHADGYTRWYVLAADRLTMRGPEGTVLTNDPPAAEATDGGSAAVWTGDDGNSRDVDDETYVAFGPDRGIPTTVATQATIGLDAAPFVLEGTARMTVLPSLVLLLLLAGSFGLSKNLLERHAVPPDRVALGAAALAGGIGLVALLTGAGPTFGGSGSDALAVVPFSYAAVAGSAWWLVRTGRTSLGAFLVVAGLGGVLVGGYGLAALPGTGEDLLEGVLTPALLVLPPLLFLPVGYATRRRTGVAIGALVLAVPLSLALGVLPMVPVGGFGAFFAAIFLIVWSLVGGTFGAALFLVGYAADGGASTRLMGSPADVGT